MGLLARLSRLFDRRDPITLEMDQLLADWETAVYRGNLDKPLVIELARAAQVRLGRNFSRRDWDRIRLMGERVTYEPTTEELR